MANVDEEPTVAERLGRLLDRGLLPAGGPAEAAERLIERLTRPARVALLGLPGSGKSAILNLLAGTVVVPETLRLPTIIVQYGDEPRMHCTLSDGQNVTLPGRDLEAALPLSPALITLELDLPALGVISLLEVAAGPMEAEQRRAALWAGKRADILIWCSTAYLPKEQLVWEGMPDAYKDNGFLLLTKVDLLGGREAASGMYHRVSQRASGEFRQVIPISAKEARAATTEGKPIDRDRFRESGAATVISTIKSRVQMAKQADMDTAELLLARHSELVPPPQRPKFELKAVEPSDALTESEESLAAEAEALQRIAAAAAQAIAETSPPPQKSVSEPVEPTVEVIQLDPFPEPEPEPEPAEIVAPDPSSDEGLTRGLKAILRDSPDTETEPVATSPDGTAIPATDLVESREPAEEPGQDRGEIVASELAAADSTPATASTLQGEGLGVADMEGPPIAPEGPPEVGESNLRFAARLKQISPESQAGPTGLVPLRATWKSRSDAFNAMPIVPKPEPNRNPTLRQLPEGTASETRLVGRGARLVDPQASSATGTASASGQPQDVAVEPTSSEPERRATKVTSVFASRTRPEPAKEEPAELQPPVEAEIEPPASVEFVPETAPLPPEPAIGVPEAQDREAMPIEVTKEPGVETLTPPDPEMDDARLRLSERLRRPSRPVSVLRVSRLETPTPAPQELVGSRMDNPRDTRTDVQPIERRERPRIVPRVLPSGPQPISQDSLALKDLERTLLAEGIGLIAARAVELSDQIDPDEKPPLDLILEHCGETVDHVLTILSQGSSPHIRRISTSLVDFQDLIMLMQLEKGRAPADDALTLLLQLRREMETLSAG